jgi:hypothetical protein
MSERKPFTPSQQRVAPSAARWKELVQLLSEEHLRVPNHACDLFARIDRDYPGLSFREFLLALKVLRAAWRRWEEKKCLARH